MLSRVAENIFWMSRYMERTTFHLRYLQTLYIAYQDNVPVFSWQDICKQYKVGCTTDDNVNIGDVLSNIVFESNNENSLFNNIFKARENARSAQDHITKELWQSLNDFHFLMKDAHLQNQLKLYDPISVFDQLIKQSMFYYGIVENSMARDEGFYFLKSGKQVERIIQLTDSLKRQLLLNDGKEIVNEESGWRYFLLSISGLEFYLRKHAGGISPENIFNQAIYEPYFPNSIRYILNQLSRFSKNLQREGIEEVNKEIDFSVGKTIAHVDFTKHENSTIGKLQFLEEIQQNTYNVIQCYNQHYFGIVY